MLDFEFIFGLHTASKRVNLLRLGPPEMRKIPCVEQGAQYYFMAKNISANFWKSILINARHILRKDNYIRLIMRSIKFYCTVITEARPNDHNPDNFKAALRINPLGKQLKLGEILLPGSSQRLKINHAVLGFHDEYYKISRMTHS